MKSRFLVVAVALAAAATPSIHAGTAAGQPAQPHEPSSREFVESVPRDKRVYMVADSVGLGAKFAMPRAFPDDWQVVVDGKAAQFVERLESDFVRQRMVDSPWMFGDHAIVAGGYNYPYWSDTRFDDSIDSMIEALTEAGVKHVYWVTLREVKREYVSTSAWNQALYYSWYLPEVNEHLEAAVARHPNLTLIDWAAAADRPDITYDAIHLNNAGSALYSSIARDTIYATTSSVANRSETRISIPNAEGVDAVAINLTTVHPRSGGFLRAYSCDEDQPNVSNHNYARAQIVAHSAIVPVSDSGEICIFALTATNLVVDITGRFTAEANLASSAPARVTDTRVVGDRAKQPPLEPLVVSLGDPDSTYVIGVTSVGAEAPGWVRAAPCDATATTSNLNMNDGSPVPNVVVISPDENETICVTTSVTSHLIVDRFVTLGPESGITIDEPRRVLDTRDSVVIEPGGVVELSRDDLGIDEADTGVLMNLTSTLQAQPGYLTAYPCAGGRPQTSHLGYFPGLTVANFALIEPDADGRICVYSLSQTHIVIDVMGATTSGFTGGVQERLLDTRR